MEHGFDYNDTLEYECPSCLCGKNFEDDIEFNAHLREGVAKEMALAGLEDPTRERLMSRAFQFKRARIRVLDACDLCAADVADTQLIVDLISEMEKHVTQAAERKEGEADERRTN